MGENSAIEWTRHTFNPWRGCARVSEGCRHCYAETLSKRNPKVLGTWGVDGTRVIASEAYWRQPLKWAAAARELGERHRVFCASLADVGEDRPDLVEPRARLCDLIRQTADALDWMLLTKRIENMERLFPADVLLLCWVGVTTENQQAFNERAWRLARIACRVRFLSMEPLLGPITWNRHTVDVPWAGGAARGGRDYSPLSDFIDLVIVGGESGAGAETRPMHPNWPLAIRDACARDETAFFFKQWGEWMPALEKSAGPFSISDHERIRIWPDREVSFRVGKKAAGRLLDGRTWNEMPEVRQ